jgi:hypothetical protein
VPFLPFQRRKRSQHRDLGSYSLSWCGPPQMTVILSSPTLPRIVSKPFVQLSSCSLVPNYSGLLGAWVNLLPESQTISPFQGDYSGSYIGRIKKEVNFHKYKNMKVKYSFGFSFLSSMNIIRNYFFPHSINTTLRVLLKITAFGFKKGL